jgi:DNA-binding NtrC family response regulator
MAQTTQPSGGSQGLPVRGLEATVTEGPDAGARATAASEVLSIGTAKDNDLVLTDPTVSRYHLELVGGGDLIRVIDHGSTNGTTYERGRIERAAVPPGSTLGIGRTSIRVGDGARLTVELHGEDELGDLRGRTPVMRRLMAQIRRAGGSDSAVLLIGESGTGKELIARGLHENGKRSACPFVTVDCGALSPSLVASELFGHEKGAFTGADQRHQGAFERAHGGTLFLDEIGELPSSLQPALLGALERGRFRRVGGRTEVEVDVRVISATHRDLRSEVNAGRFRLDLYYRIAVVVLRIPPLRERPEDIPLLVEHFLQEAGGEASLVGDDLLRTLCEHSWPGNVRELRNVVEALVVMGEVPALDAAMAATSGDDDVLHLSYKEARARVLSRFEDRYLPKLLERAGGNVSEAARLAQMDRTYLIKLLAKRKA